MQAALVANNMYFICAGKLRWEFTVFVRGAFALFPYEIPGSRFKRAKEAQRYINSVVAGEVISALCFAAVTAQPSLFGCHMASCLTSSSNPLCICVQQSYWR